MSVSVSVSVCFCLHTCYVPDRQHIQNKMEDSLPLLASRISLTLPIVVDIFCCLEHDGRIHSGRTVTERTELYWDIQHSEIHAAQRPKN